jgi:hypothetical protein
MLAQTLRPNKEKNIPLFARPIFGRSVNFISPLLVIRGRKHHNQKNCYTIRASKLYEIVINIYRQTVPVVLRNSFIQNNWRGGVDKKAGGVQE